MCSTELLDNTVSAGLAGVEQSHSPPAQLVQTIVLVAGIHRYTMRLVEFAEAQGAPWRAVHVALDESLVAAIRERWETDVGLGELVILKSHDGSLVSPIRRYIERYLFRYPTGLIQVVIGQVHTGNAITQLLHRTPDFISRYALHDLERVVTTIVPIHLTPHDGWKIETSPTLLGVPLTGRTLAGLAVLVCFVLTLLYYWGWAAPWLP